jgi:hypothetical protein
MKTLRHRSAGLLTTSLLLAGVSALTPTSVRAADTCSFGGSPGTACHLDFIFDKQEDKTLKLTKLPTIGMGTIQFVQQTPGVWVVDVDFIPDLSAPSGLGMLEYDLTIDPLPLNNQYFLEGGLAIIGPPVGDPQFKVKKFATGLPMLMADEIDPQVSAIFDDGLKTISVRDEYLVTMGSINSFQNSFTQITRTEPDRVPGPLPLLGAGAAFGFSRRLRTRVLAARGA